MKITKLEIQNLGMIEDMVIPIDKPLVLFYGSIRQGKTTILNAVKWCFGGAFPDDIIRHGQNEARVKLSFENGSVERTWYRQNDGGIKARDIVLVIDGEVKKRPVTLLQSMINPFLLDQDHFRKMNETDRRRYLVELFDVDTKDIDAELTKTEQAARDLRAIVKAYGSIDITPVKKPDLEGAQAALEFAKQRHKQSLEDVKAELKALEDSEAKRKATLRLEIDARRSAYDQLLHEIRERNKKADEQRARRLELTTSIDNCESEIKRLESEIQRWQQKLDHERTALLALGTIEYTKEPLVPDYSELQKQFDDRVHQGASGSGLFRTTGVIRLIPNCRSNSTIEYIKEPLAPDYSELQKQIDDDSVFKSQREAMLTRLSTPANVGVQEAMLEQAREQMQRYNGYQEKLQRLESRKQHEEALAIQESKIKDLREAKVKKLDSYSDETKVPGLKFSEDGGFVYNGTAAGMLSTSQIMELSTKLEALYPEGIGVTLIDRGESLGTSIFDYINEAKRDNKAILATVVGDKPATMPDEASVWVVSDGRLES